jgi:hypothetical protein
VHIDTLYEAPTSVSDTYNLALYLHYGGFQSKWRYQNGGRNTESCARKNYGNAPKPTAELLYILTYC